MSEGIEGKKWFLKMYLYIMFECLHTQNNLRLPAIPENCVSFLVSTDTYFLLLS